MNGRYLIGLEEKHDEFSERTVRILEATRNLSNGFPAKHYPVGGMISIHFPEDVRLHVFYQDGAIYVPNGNETSKALAKDLFEAYLENIGEEFTLI